MSRIEISPIRFFTNPEGAKPSIPVESPIRRENPEIGTDPTRQPLREPVQPIRIPSNPVPVSR